jgi:hypothetical protein
MHALEGSYEIESKKQCHKEFVGLRKSVSISNLNLTEQDLARVLAIIDEKASDCDPGSSNWTFQGATYFWWSVMSTVGYGSFTPQTTGGKVFTFILAVPSIAVFVLLITSLSKHITAAADRFLKRVCKRPSQWDTAGAGTNKDKSTEVEVEAEELEQALDRVEVEEGGGKGSSAEVLNRWHSKRAKARA